MHILRDSARLLLAVALCSAAPSLALGQSPELAPGPPATSPDQAPAPPPGFGQPAAPAPAPAPSPEPVAYPAQQPPAGPNGAQWQAPPQQAPPQQAPSPQAPPPGNPFPQQYYGPGPAPGPYGPGPYGVAPAEPPWPRKGLMIAGFATLGGGYLFTALVGLEIMAQKDEAEAESTPYMTKTCVNCDETGPYLLIPLVGPFLALPAADGTDGKVVCAMLGGVQIVGLAMAIFGTSIYRKDRAVYDQWERDHGQISLLDGWYLTSDPVGLGGRGLATSLALGRNF